MNILVLGVKNDVNFKVFIFMDITLTNNTKLQHIIQTWFTIWHLFVLFIFSYRTFFLSIEIHSDHLITNPTLNSVAIQITFIFWYVPCIVVTVDLCFCGVLHHSVDWLLQGGGHQREVSQWCLCQGDQKIDDLILRRDGRWYELESYQYWGTGLK